MWKLKKHPKNILYNTRHYYAKIQLFDLKKRQYQLLAGPQAHTLPAQNQAAKLARDAVRYAQKWSKYLDYASNS